MEAPQLSTMVVLYTTNLKFDTTKLAETIPLSETIIKVEKKGVVKRGESSRDKIRHRVKKEKKNTSNTGFGHNSITLVMVNNGDGSLAEKEITVKIFQNGVFHLTGVLNELYDRHSLHNLIEILQTSCRDSFKENIETIEILNRRVVLMNYTTKLISNQTIPREALHTGIRNAKLENVVSYYDPDVYPGVKIHIGNNKWTANVFRTGKIILTGITSHDDCILLIEKLITLFEEVLPTRLTRPYTS
jgi:TATA-box binding protein (TBP) (component of TFIID and TFIIIB)